MAKGEHTLEQRLGGRLWQNGSFRKGVYLSLIFGASLATIYSFPTEKPAVEIRTHHRIEASGKTKEKGGLSVNGIRVDYKDESRVYTFDDFGKYASHGNSIRLCSSAGHPMKAATVELEKNGSIFTQQVQFQGTVGEETKEIIYDGAKLKRISIDTPSELYMVEFQ